MLHKHYEAKERKKNHTFLSIQFKTEQKQKNTLIYNLTKKHTILIMIRMEEENARQIKKVGKQHVLFFIIFKLCSFISLAI